jgi:hypothetical protein
MGSANNGNRRFGMQTSTATNFERVQAFPRQKNSFISLTKLISLNLEEPFSN